MNEELKNAALMYALGADNLEEIVQKGGIFAGEVAVTMRSVIKRIQANMQKRPQPRLGVVLVENRAIIYTKRWEIRVSVRHGSITSRATGEIVKDW
jgi:hypothetical protein